MNPSWPKRQKTHLVSCLKFFLILFLIHFAQMRQALAQVSGTLSTKTEPSDRSQGTTSLGQKNYQLSSKLELGFQHLNSEWADEAAQSFVFMGLRWDHSLQPWASIRISPLLVTRTGYIQSDLFNPQDQRASITMETIHLRLGDQSEKKGFRFDTGILAVNGVVSPLLANRVGQTGVGLGWANTWHDQYCVTTQAYGLVPQSFQQNYTFDQRRALPWIQIYHFKTELCPREWGLGVSLSRWKGLNLPESLAEQSNLAGNSVIFAPGDQRIGFAHEFDIWEGAIEGRWRFSPRWEIHGRFVFIENQLAPVQLNRGYLGELKLSHLRGKQIFSTQVQYYFIEPDAAVSALNSGFFETNRIGQRAILSFSPDNQTNTLSLLVGQRQVVYLHPFQQGDLVTAFQWEMRHDIF